jgi:hypothetical protein
MAAMIPRSSRFRRSMARLALAAMLLVALAPTVSRWLEATAQPLAAAFSAMCTSHGLVLAGEPAPEGVAMAAGHAKPAQSPAMPAHPGMDDACGYCSLLANVAPLLFAILVLLFRFRPPRLPGGAPSLRLHQVRLPGLGARGPPIAL